MLKSRVMQKLLSMLMIIPFLNLLFAQDNQLDLVRITSPQEGDVLQGSVYIQGSVTGSTFQYAEVSFQYQETQSSNWFFISTIDTPVVDDTIAIWDTSTIADGLYRVKVVAFYEDDRTQEAVINNLDIRNYTPIDPVATEESIIKATEGIIESVTSTPTTLSVEPTTMPSNEMTVTRSQYILTLLQGALFGILLLMVIVLLVIIRRRKIG
jgi:hypothetical protein